MIRHAYGDSFTGMLCGQMVTLPDGSGDQCGRRSTDPIHTDFLETTIKLAIGYEPVPLSIRDHPEIRLEHRTAADRDGLVERISAALKPIIAESQAQVLEQFGEKMQHPIDGHTLDPWTLSEVGLEADALAIRLRAEVSA